MSLARTARTPATPSTPTTPAAQADVASTPGGAWKHPRFDEIARRQYATTFDERNVRAIVANGGLLLLSVYGSAVASSVGLLEWAARPLNTLVTAVPYSDWAMLLVRLVLAANIATAFLPLVRRRYFLDDLADIPLTPSQRATLGLKGGLAMPQTPGSALASPNYVTPPRYQRSTPRSGSFSNHDRRSQSPVPGPFSPNTSTGSPLFQRALSGSSSKRLSYGGSPMAGSLFGDSSSSAVPGTPTPSTGRASVGLNNKWLYEKRRDSPGSSIFT
ncbi:hypothetical protein ACEQ8H_008537 [Pleosporales sp. CAS-2024a]